MEALFLLGQRGSVGLVFSYGEKKVRENAALSFGVERHSSYRHSPLSVVRVLPSKCML